MMRLLDTDVLVDVVRNFPPALRWLAALPDKPGIPGIVMMELVVGCTNKLELLRVENITKPYTLYWLTLPGNQAALAYLSQFHLSHRLGLQDALIAATAIELGATLCTFNTKHFAAVPSLVIEQPYARQ